ncbi:hypothetical protein ACKWTF_003695 [Chironomus riparius]
MMMSIKGGYLIFIILLIGLNHLRADEDITEAISDTTDATTTQPFELDLSENTEESLRSEDSNEEDEVKNPTIQRLPADSESIRDNIVDSEFDCEDTEPGYYADMENDCQIFHRCVQGHEGVYSFICPTGTRFDQRVLVCVWEHQYNFDCSQSRKYYHDSNRAFLGNLTAEENLNENIKNSQEIKTVEIIEHHTSRPLKEEVKLYEIIPTEELSITSDDESPMVEINSIEEAEKNSIDEKEVESVSEEMEESNDYQAELIPSSTNHIDASVATSDISDSTSSFDVDSEETPQPPHKYISLSVLDPIIEMPGDDDQTQESVTTIRNIRKRSGSHRRRFLFKADAH